MITNNVKNLFKVFADRSSSNVFFPSIGNDEMYCPVTVSNSLNVLYAITGAQVSYEGTTAGFSWLDVGFGDTPEAADDRRLADSNHVQHKLTAIASGSNQVSTGEIINIYTNFRNDGNSNVVVKELGVIGNPTGQSSSGDDRFVLLYRKVLDSPITIAPGEQYSFNYVVRFE